MGMKGLWILQKGLYEGRETCRKVLYVCVFASLRRYEEPLSGDAFKYFVTAGKIVRILIGKIKPH
jgi:hypothetical protein